MIMNKIVAMFLSLFLISFPASAVSGLPEVDKVIESTGLEQVEKVNPSTGLETGTKVLSPIPQVADDRLQQVATNVGDEYTGGETEVASESVIVVVSTVYYDPVIQGYFFKTRNDGEGVATILIFQGEQYNETIHAGLKMLVGQNVLLYIREDKIVHYIFDPVEGQTYTTN